MAENRPVRVAVANDYALVVAGTAGVLAPYRDRIDVVELDSGVRVASEVDVVLYDTFGQAQGSAIDSVDVLADTSAKLVVFSWNTDRALVKDSVSAGAAGFVSKSVTAEELVDAIERVHRGEVVVPPETTDDESGETFGRWPGDELGLSAREAEVLALICQGLSNQEITERAFIGINTVKTYIRSLYRKIDVTTRAQAVVWGLSHGFEPDRLRRLHGGSDPVGAPSPRT